MCLYILLYVKEQYSYDIHHKDAKDIYRITSLLTTSGDKHDSMATSSPPIAPAIKRVTGNFDRFFTVSFQAIKAAMANPVKSLRSE